MRPVPPPTASTLELLTYIHGKLEALGREIEVARADDASANVELQLGELRLLGEIAHRLWPRDQENSDPEFMLILRKREAIANLLVALRSSLVS